MAAGGVSCHINFFCFEEETAYEVGVRLVGSEMGIRGRRDLVEKKKKERKERGKKGGRERGKKIKTPQPVSYTHLTLPTIA